MSAPVPDEANVSLPGLAFAMATKSFTDCAFELAGTTKMIVP